MAWKSRRLRKDFEAYGYPLPKSSINRPKPSAPLQSIKPKCILSYTFSPAVSRWIFFEVDVPRSDLLPGRPVRLGPALVR